MSLERITEAHVVQVVKERSAEALRTATELLGAAEAQLKGASLQDIVNRGKLAALNAVGLFHESNAGTLYNHRLKGLTRTRRLLEEMDDEFKGLVADAAALNTRFVRLCRLLERFRICCDTHITVSVEEEEAIARREDEEGGVLVDVPMASPSSQHNAEILRFQCRMQDIIEELKQTSLQNCTGICRAALSGIDESSAKVVQSVTSAKTTLDLQRRKVQQLKETLDKLRGEVNRLPDGNTHKALRVMQLEQSEAGLSARVEEEQSLRRQFEESVHKGVSALHFALEQSSMSTWSMYNILFSQMTHFFEDAGAESRNIAKVFAALKNDQSVSKRITEEKRERMRLQDVAQSTAVSPGPAAASSFSPSQVQTNGRAGGAKGLQDLFDNVDSAVVPATQPTAQQQQQPGDDFEDFLASRQRQGSSEGRTSLGATSNTAGSQPSGAKRGNDDAWGDLFGS